MDNELLEKLDNLLNSLDNSEEIKRFIFLKNKLLNDKELMDKINTIKNESYSDKYINIKEELINNKDFKEYKELEKRLYYLVQNINKDLSKLKVKNESN